MKTNPTNPDSNPWMPHSRNLSEQARITKADPARANELRALAARHIALGKPLSTTPDGLAALAKQIRQLSPADAKKLEAMLHEQSGETNPFRTGNLTEQALLTRRDPARAEQLRAAAKQR